MFRKRKMEKSLVDIQTELFLKQKYVKITNTESIDSLLEKILDYSKKEKTFLILIYLEIIYDDKQLKKVFNFIKSLPNKTWIMSSTATSHPLYVEPIVNLLMWKDYLQDELIDYRDGTFYVPAFPRNLWNDKQYKINDKTIKSILSIRRSNIQRDLLYKEIDKNDVSILRYYDKEPDKKYPKWNELIDEYLKTYVAFVSETNYPTNTNTTCFTEKTILSFLCGNIPIILGKKNLIRELEEMGFWIANKDFGFTDLDDNEEDYSKVKIQSFLNCIKNVNKIDIKKYYTDNIHHINNNHEIIQNYFNKKIFLI